MLFLIRVCIFINSWWWNDEKSIFSFCVSYGELFKMENEEILEDKVIRSENCFYLLVYYVFGFDVFLCILLICFICNNLKKNYFLFVVLERNFCYWVMFFWDCKKKGCGRFDICNFIDGFKLV